MRRCGVSKNRVRGFQTDHRKPKLCVVDEKSPFHLSSDSRGGNEWYRESAKAKSEDVLGDCASNTDPGVFVCKAYKQSSRSPRSPASDLVGLHTLAFDYWYERIEADGFKIARDPTVDKSPLQCAGLNRLEVEDESSLRARATPFGGGCLTLKLVQSPV